MASMESTTRLSRLSACPECDLLLANVRLEAGQEATCPRCGHVVREGKPDSVLRALALSSTGLVLFAPAMGLPLLSLSILGLHQQCSLLQAVIALFQGGYPEVGLVVALCALAAPFANLWLMFSISLSLKVRHRPRVLPLLLRINHWIREWSMLEVFLLGVLVSMVKLRDMADLLPGPGLYCFTGLMLVTLLMESLVDEHEFWQTLDESDDRRSRL